MFNTGLIDSLKIRIERDKISILDPNLVLPYMKFYPDNLTFENSLNDAEPFLKIENGITYRYYFKTYPNKQRVLKEYLVLQISAKMLKEKYFEGITKHNFKSILQDINNQYVVKISEEVFLNALVSDIDICINQLIDIKTYQSGLSFIRSFPKQSCKPLMHFIEKYNKQGKVLNLGLDFNKREKATNTRPYCKIYHKGIELQTKSAEFFNTFLSHFKDYRKSAFLDNLVRYEFTIKAYDHKKYLIEKKLLNNELKTLKDLLNISSKELTLIAKSGLPHYIEPKKPIAKTEGLKPIDRLLAFYMQQLINLGANIDDLKDVLPQFECRVTKSKIKSKINEILTHITTENHEIENQLKMNDQLKEFLQNFGL